MAENEAAEAGAEVDETMPGADGAATMPRSVDGAVRFSFSFDIPSLPRFDSLKTWSHQALINGALAGAIALIVLIWLYGRVFQDGAVVPLALSPEAPDVSLVAPNSQSTYNPTVDTPSVSTDAFVDPTASVVGNITVAASAYIGRGVIVDSSAGQPISIGSGTNLQAGASISARPTFVRSSKDESAYTHAVEGEWAVYIGREVSVGAGASLVGPLAILDEAYVGANATVIEATIGAGSVVEPGALVMGVEVPAGRYVPAGTLLTDQHDADALPEIVTGYAMKNAGIETVALHLALLQSLGFSGHVEEVDLASSPAADAHEETTTGD
jgi:carbonic anhydrase/acetyltransferase-like protein (isoleucine patch superfamily)